MKYQMMGGQCSMRRQNGAGRRTKRTGCPGHRNVNGQRAGAYGRSSSAGFASLIKGGGRRTKRTGCPYRQRGSGRRTKRTGCPYRQRGSGRRTKRTGCPYRQRGSGRKTKRAISLNNQRKLRKTKRTSCHGRGNNQHVHQRAGYAIIVDEVKENQ